MVSKKMIGKLIIGRAIVESIGVKDFMNQSARGIFKFVAEEMVRIIGRVSSLYACASNYFPLF